MINGSKLLNLSEEEASQLFENLPKDSNGEVNMDVFLDTFQSTLREKDEFRIIQQWDASSAVRLAMSFPVLMFLTHRDREKARVWRKANSIIKFDDELIDTIRSLQQERVLDLDVFDGESNLKDQERESESNRPAIDRQKTRVFHRHDKSEFVDSSGQENDGVDIGDRRESLTFAAQKIAAKAIDRLNRNRVNDHVKNTAEKILHECENHNDNSMDILKKYRPLGFIEARISARSILRWCIKRLISKDEKNLNYVKATFTDLSSENKKVKDARKSILEGVINDPLPTERIARYAFRHRKLFMVPLRLAEFCTLNIDVNYFQDEKCSRFLRVLREAHRLGDGISRKGNEDVLNAVRAFFDQYQQLREDYSNMFCSHLQSSFGIKPYDESSHSAWVRHNSSLLEYLLEFRGAAKYEWGLLTRTIERTFKSLGHRNHYRMFEMDVKEVTRSDFAWSLVVLENHLTGLPTPERGASFRLAALAYVKFAK